MELKLIRALFPSSTMAQLYKNNKLLCMYVGANTNKGATPIDGLPDGRYSLRKPRTGKGDWDLQITDDKSRKPLLMNFSDLTQKGMDAYDSDIPIYISWGTGQQQMTEKALENISFITAAIAKGEPVFISIKSEFLAI